MDTTHATLTGSEKQIAWAADIRTRILQLCETFRNESIGHAATAGQPATAVTDQTDPLLAKMQAQTEATWWIEMNKKTVNVAGKWFLAVQAA